LNEQRAASVSSRLFSTGQLRDYLAEAVSIPLADLAGCGEAHGERAQERPFGACLSILRGGMVHANAFFLPHDSCGAVGFAAPVDCKRQHAFGECTVACRLPVAWRSVAWPHLAVVPEAG
jgi:hypothetical protein